MYRFAKAAFNITGRAARQVRQVRNGSSFEPDFHDKHGNTVMISGTVFCVAVWAYLLTQTGLTWYPSPVGRVMPKEWREKEEEE